MPTKQMSSLLSARAAATVIISDALYGMAVTQPLSGFGKGAFAKRLGGCIHHMFLDPPLKCFAISRDRVPGDIEGVVTRVVAMRVRRMGAARHDRNCAHGPRRQDDGVGADAFEALDKLLDRDDGRSRREDGFFLHADDAFEQDVAGAIGLLRVDDRDVGPVRRDSRQVLAGEGAATLLMFGFTFARSDPL